MAKIKITKPDGTPTPYFWSDTEAQDRKRLTVFKETKDGIKRMTGVHYDSVAKRVRRD